MNKEIISSEIKALFYNEANKNSVVEGSPEFDTKLNEIKNILETRGSVITVINGMLVEVTQDSKKKISVKKFP